MTFFCAWSAKGIQESSITPAAGLVCNSNIFLAPMRRAAGPLRAVLHQRQRCACTAQRGLYQTPFGIPQTRFYSLNPRGRSASNTTSQLLITSLRGRSAFKCHIIVPVRAGNRQNPIKKAKAIFLLGILSFKSLIFYVKKL